MSRYLNSAYFLSVSRDGSLEVLPIERRKDVREMRLLQVKGRTVVVAQVGDVIQCTSKKSLLESHPALLGIYLSQLPSEKCNDLLAGQALPTAPAAGAGSPEPIMDCPAEVPDEHNADVQVETHEHLVETGSTNIPAPGVEPDFAGSPIIINMEDLAKFFDKDNVSQITTALHQQALSQSLGAMEADKVDSPAGALHQGSAGEDLAELLNNVALQDTELNGDLLQCLNEMHVEDDIGTDANNSSKSNETLLLDSGVADLDQGSPHIFTDSQLEQPATQDTCSGNEDSDSSPSLDWDDFSDEEAWEPPNAKEPKAKKQQKTLSRRPASSASMLTAAVPTKENASGEQSPLKATAPTADLHLIHVIWFGTPPQNCEFMPTYVLIPGPDAVDLKTATDMAELMKRWCSAREGYQALDHLTVSIDSVTLHVDGYQQVLAAFVTSPILSMQTYNLASVAVLQPPLRELRGSPVQKLMQLGVLGQRRNSQKDVFQEVKNLLRPHTTEMQNVGVIQRGRLKMDVGAKSTSLSPEKLVKRSPVKVLSKKTAGTGKKKKPQYCMKCDKFISNIHRHMRTSLHADLVKKSRGNKQVELILVRRQIQKSNAHFNNNVAANKKGDLIPAKRSSKEKRRDNELMQCNVCLKSFSKKGFLHRHLPLCEAAREAEIKLMQELDSDDGEGDAGSSTSGLQIGLLTPPASSPSKKFKVFPIAQLNIAANLNMQGTEVDSTYVTYVHSVLKNIRDKGNLVKDLLTTCDATVIDLVKVSMANQEFNLSNRSCIVRRRLRLTAKVFNAFKNHPEIPGAVQTIVDIFKSANWNGTVNNRKVGAQPRVVEICLEIVGGSETSSHMQKPNDMMSISAILRELCTSIPSQRSALSEEEQKKINDECSAFLRFQDSPRWNVPTTRKAGLNKRLNEKLNKVRVGSSEDMRKYTSYLDEQCTEWYDYSMDCAAKGLNKAAAYDKLAGYVACAFGTFNARRGDEPGKILTSEWTDREQDTFAGLDDSLSAILIEQSKEFDLIMSKGKGLQKILSLCKKKWRPYLDHLANAAVRAAANIPPECPYLFGNRRKNDLTINYRRLQEQATVACGAEQPKLIRSRFIRTTFATTIGRLNLSNEAKKMICLLMGHSKEVHDRFYELPLGASFSLIMGAALTMNEAGTINDNRGTTLEAHAGLDVPINQVPLRVDEGAGESIMDDLVLEIQIENADEEELEIECEAEIARKNPSKKTRNDKHLPLQNGRSGASSSSEGLHGSSKSKTSKSKSRKDTTMPAAAKPKKSSASAQAALLRGGLIKKKGPAGRGPAAAAQKSTSGFTTSTQKAPVDSVLKKKGPAGEGPASPAIGITAAAAASAQAAPVQQSMLKEKGAAGEGPASAAIGITAAAAASAQAAPVQQSMLKKKGPAGEGPVSAAKKKTAGAGALATSDSVGSRLHNQRLRGPAKQPAPSLAPLHEQPAGASLKRGRGRPRKDVNLPQNLQQESSLEGPTTRKRSRK